MLQQNTVQVTPAHSYATTQTVQQKQKTCQICATALSISKQITVGGLQYKSCPCCSQAAGEHVFYPLDKFHFGFSKLRSSPTYPDGRQSHCTACRKDSHLAGECTYSLVKYASGIRCSELNK